MDRWEYFRSCVRKCRYSTFVKAAMIAKMCTEARGRKIYVYRCEWNINHWHLSHVLGKDGVNIHAPGFNYMTFDADAKIPKPNGTRVRLNRSWLQTLRNRRIAARTDSSIG